MDCAVEKSTPVSLRRQPTEILDPLSNEIVRIIPLPVAISPVKSLPKKPSKKDSVKKLLSKGSCVSSSEAIPLAHDLRTEDHTNAIVSKFITESTQMEGSMDIDDYCEAGMTQIQNDINEEPVEPTENSGNDVDGASIDIEEAANTTSKSNEELVYVEESDGIASAKCYNGNTEDDETEVTNTPISNAIIDGASNVATSLQENVPDNEMDVDESGIERESSVERQVTTCSESSAMSPDNHHIDKNLSPSNATSFVLDNGNPAFTPFGPPPIEIIITFDTTGSMSYYLDEVKNQINDIINRLFMDIPNLKIGLIAHGDYCDENVYYLTQKMDLTNDINSLCEMVKNVEGTGGGDFAECYELILRNARLVNWTPGSQRALIMIGDACPHTTSELNSAGLEEIDWQVEAKALKYEMGVRVYGVQCQDHSEAGTFWDDLAEVTQGQHLKLDKFSAIIDIIMAICYREGGDHYLQAYEKEVRAREGRMLATEVDQAFGVLKSKSAVTAPSTSSDGSNKTLKITCGAKKAQKKQPSAKVIASKKVKQPACSTGKGKILQKLNENKVIVKSKPKTQKKSEKKKKQMREVVSEAHFAAKHLSWSPWIKLISSKADESSDVCHHRRYQIGYRHSGAVPALEKYSNKPALFELAVQAKPRCRRHVVHFHAIDGIKNPNGSWKKLVITPKINKLVDNVLRQGPEVSIFVRRLVLHSNSKINGCNVKSAAACRKVMSNIYDYPWRKSSNRRNLVKNGITLYSSSWR